MTQSEDSRNKDEYPKTFSALVGLYYDRYKPLYSRIQTFNEMPVELVFEVAAAWDHLSRCWRFGEPEAGCVDKAARHIKRAVFDAYKLLLKQTVDDYDDIKRIDTSLIDNGNFDERLRILMSEIRADSVEARDSEGDTGGVDGWNKAFALWGAVYQKMEKFHRDFYLNPNIEWARTKTSDFTSKRRWEGFWIGVASGVVGSGIFAAIVWLATRWVCKS
jgi:hypothetical protein